MTSDILDTDPNSLDVDLELLSSQGPHFPVASSAFFVFSRIVIRSLSHTARLIRQPDLVMRMLYRKSPHYVLDLRRKSDPVLFDTPSSACVHTHNSIPLIVSQVTADLRDARDAHIVFEAVRLNVLPLVTRRLTTVEREQLGSGNVFVWEEAEHKQGMFRYIVGYSSSLSR